MRKANFHCVILDEAQNVKNPKTQAAQVVCQLKARHRFCLTGTPLENHLGEAQGWMEKAFKIPGLLVRDELSLLTLEGRLALKAGRPKAAQRAFEQIEKLAKEHPYGEYRLHHCSSALGMMEALRALGQPTWAFSETVKSCLDNKNNTLGPWDLGNLRRHAKKSGISN